MINIASILKAFEKSKFVIALVDNYRQFRLLESQVKFFDDSIKIITLPAWDVEPYGRISPSARILGKRLKAFLDIDQLDDNNTLIITTVDGIAQKIPPLSEITRAVLNLSVGDEVDRDKLLLNLINIGYIRVSTAETAGEFAVRGGIIDIISYEDIGYRLDFFGSKLEAIKVFDPMTQLTSAKQHKLTILPTSEVLLTKEKIAFFKENYLQTFGLQDDPLYHDVAKGYKYAGTEHWLPFFYPKLETIFDYVPQDAQIVPSTHSAQNLHEFYLTIEENYQQRLNAKAKEKNYNPLQPTALYLEQSFLDDKLKSVIEERSYITAPNIYQHSKIYNMPPLQVLANYNGTKKICIACESDGSLDRISKMIDNPRVVKNASELMDGINLAVISVGSSLIFDDVTFFSEQEIFGKKIAQKSKRTKNTARFFQELQNIEIDELLVHLEYGVGRFKGLKTLVVQQIPHDFIEIIYADNDKLYLPVENLEMISRYGEENGLVSLDKLGGLAWQSRKAKLKARIKLAAEALLKTAAARQTASAVILEPISEFYDKFLDQFFFTETEDQAAAIQDVLDDLASGIPMDRLICADVGFGKTEVALRAACATVLGSHKLQVAIIVPTTLLARQHYLTFYQRFKGLPVTIEQLSKFTPRRDIASIKNGLKDGSVDIVIGTHALLANDIGFKDLGLIVIDEEQHFGVAQKEKLKGLKNNVHVLTLSATPIPRTLQMAMTDIKSLSIIATPPVERMPVKTAIMPYDGMTIRDALLREKSRGGLSFYVTPRVRYLDDLETQLQHAVPELKVVKAHGGLPPATLDQIMNDFFDHKFDVLLSTSIIESGLDVQSANTIIVDRANMFGLSQLYQMRGRVGRGGIQAFAHFITSKNNALSQIAKKRMEILASLQALGSGFSVASHDMDTRGYGNLLGDEQSGHIKEVGIELYQKMLADMIEELQEHKQSAVSDWSPLINLGISVQLPDSYIADCNLRLTLYRQIADITEEEEADKFAAEMIDRFGKLPEEAEHLFDIIKVKSLAKKANIAKVDAGDKGLVFTFKNQHIVQYEKVLAQIQSEREFEGKLRPEGKILFLLRHGGQKYDKIMSAKRLLATYCQHDLQ